MKAIARSESDVQARPDHSEIVSRAADHAPAQVVSLTNVAGDAHFEAAAKLSYQFAVTAGMLGSCVNCERARRDAGIAVVINWSLSPPPKIPPPPAHI